MDCIFRIIANENFDELKQYADGWSKKGIIIIFSKCDNIEFFKQFRNIEMLITAQNDCFYYKDEILDCNDEIIEKFDMRKFEPIIWKKDESEEDIPF